jgi:hypothetical protein
MLEPWQCSQHRMRRVRRRIYAAHLTVYRGVLEQLEQVAIDAFLTAFVTEIDAVPTAFIAKSESHATDMLLQSRLMHSPMWTHSKPRGASHGMQVPPKLKAVGNSEREQAASQFSLQRRTPRGRDPLILILDFALQTNLSH